MEICPTIEELRKELYSRTDATVGFVPTMGALHAGHISLVERAKRENDVVVMSIFVNPLQFGRNEDLDKYPRPFEVDVAKAQAAGVDLLFHPSVDEMYPGGAIKTSIHVDKLGETMEGAFRPGHFDGMATVVNKLFSIVGNARAYFGEKDWQQLAIVKQMVRDLSMPIDVIGCETVREEDGLAMSSRNVYLDDQSRNKAAIIPQALIKARRLIDQGERSAQVLSQLLRNEIGNSDVEVKYALVVGPNMHPVNKIDVDTRMCVSADIDGVHLIDNMAAM